MIRLIWKEMRERGWVLLLWAFTIIGVTVFQPDVSFFGGWKYMDKNQPFNMIPTALGLLAGSCAYSSELAKDRASFVFMRPIAWWKMWLAKFIPGIVVLIVAPLISLSLYYLFGPSCYRPFITANNFFSGMGYAIWQGAGLYLLGFLCAPVISSYAGGIVTMAIVGTVFTVPQMLLQYFFGASSSIRDNITIATTISICIAVLVGGILIARYAVRLDFQERAVRYLRVILLSLVLGVIVGAITPIVETIDLLSESQITKENRYELRAYNYDISPGGRYALVEYRWYARLNRYHPPDISKAPELRLNEMNTGTAINDTLFDKKEYSGFMTDNLLLSRNYYRNSDGIITSIIYQISSEMDIEIPRTRKEITFITDDEKYFFETKRTTFPGDITNKDHIMLTCYTFPEVHEVTCVEIKDFGFAHWLDNNTIVYLDKDQKRQTIRVGE